MPTPVAERTRAQLLSGPRAASPVAVAQRLLAIQGQDPRGARLAVRARSRGLTASCVDRCLTDDRSLVVTWLNRGTLHLVASEDHHWLLALTAAGPTTSCMARLRRLGVPAASADRGVAAVERALAAEGPLIRDELRERIAAAGVPTEGQALVHVLMLACLRGLAVRGPMKGGEHAYVLVRDWLGAPPRRERDAALAELARRYLAGHGPASDRDLARWAGVPLGAARSGLRAIGREIEERAGGLVALRGATRARALPPPRLLGAFDPVLLGWTSRTDVIDPAHGTRIVDGGIFRSFALAEGRAVALWRLQRGRVEIEPLAPIPEEVVGALEREARDVERFLAG
ncbi:MAG TPA: winged helix DNA-binding domain-containing protein [Thermoleophilaceae bacterium]|nr:winged helix DNA-binding domain-containing protein [Thermoleophilaceae bacterium]